jgi:hypothetical protein
MLLTPFPQEFNPTDDRKLPEVTCLDCHINGHTTGQFRLSPDIKPQERRFRLDTSSLRGLLISKLRAVVDFTELGRRTAYFNLMRRSSCSQEGDEYNGSRPGKPYGADPKHAGFSARSQAGF